jgi:hypothetical protein
MPGNNEAGSRAGHEAVPAALTEEDLRLGRKASGFIDVLCVAAFVVCAGMAVFVLINVPLDTPMPYSGRFGRNGIPAPVAMLPALALLFLLRRSGKKRDAHQMGKGSRGVAYVFGTVIVLACIVFQWIFAEAILVEGGVLPG